MLTLIALAAAVQSAPPPRPTLDRAYRCSALSQTASLADAENDDLFYASLYWSIAATEIARDDKVSDRDFASAQDRARKAAGETLAGSGGKAALAECISAVPSLRE